MAQRGVEDEGRVVQSELNETIVTETRTVLGNTLAKAQTDKLYSFSNLPFAAEFLMPPIEDRAPTSPNLLFLALTFCVVGATIFFFTLLWLLHGPVYSFTWVARASYVVRVRATQTRRLFRRWDPLG